MYRKGVWEHLNFRADSTYKELLTIQARGKTRNKINTYELDIMSQIGKKDPKKKSLPSSNNTVLPPCLEKDSSSFERLNNIQTKGSSTKDMKPNSHQSNESNSNIIISEKKRKCSKKKLKAGTASINHLNGTLVCDEKKGKIHRAGIQKQLDHKRQHTCKLLALDSESNKASGDGDVAATGKIAIDFPSDFVGTAYDDNAHDASFCIDGGDFVPLEKTGWINDTFAMLEEHRTDKSILNPYTTSKKKLEIRKTATLDTVKMLGNYRSPLTDRNWIMKSRPTTLNPCKNDLKKESMHPVDVPNTNSCIDFIEKRIGSNHKCVDRKFVSSSSNFSPSGLFLYTPTRRQFKYDKSSNSYCDSPWINSKISTPVLETSNGDEIYATTPSFTPLSIKKLKPRPSSPVFFQQIDGSMDKIADLPSLQRLSSDEIENIKDV